MSNKTNNKNVPELRFPEFRGARDWKERKLVALISTVKPPKKLLSVNYLTEGLFPIIDQSQNYICGWTNDLEALIKDSLPLIIFGDHTCALKITTEPFVQGADGIKILKANELVETTYLYQFLLFNPVVMEEYKRHFSILKEKLIFFPEKKSGEQQKIADCLCSIDELITTQTQKLDKLKAYKKGLMQQLFPAEGETVLKLRFPEFRDCGEWKEKKLGELAEFFKGKGLPKSTITPNGKNLCIHYGELFTEYPEVISIIKSRTDLDDCFLSISNDVLMPTSDVTPNGLAKACCIKLDNVFLGGDILVIRTDKYVINGEFLSRYIRRKEQKVLQLVTGTTVFHLYASAIEKLFISIPIFKEQQKIADYLCSIDELITTQTQKLDKLKAHKKGLMQKLFPIPR